MAIAIIINPVSGGARPDTARRRAELAADVVASYGEACEVFVTERRGHARELAASAVARGARLVVAWGGDGTVNEIGSALAFGTTPLAIIPSGSGNGLARELGTDRRAERALGAAIAALGAPARAIDVGELGGRLFFNVAGVGFDAHVAACFDGARGRRGLLSYVRISAREILRYEPHVYSVTEDGRSSEHRALLLTLANSAQFGNGAKIAPAAKLDDGRLDLVVFEEQSRIRTIWSAPKLFSGGVAGVPGLSTRRFGRLTIQCDRPMRFHVDGEPATGGTVLEARVHPGALRICAQPTRPT